MQQFIRYNLKHTIIASMLGVACGFVLFGLTFPTAFENLAHNLSADVVWSTIDKWAIAWQVYFVTTKHKLEVYSNVDASELWNPDFISIYVSSAPDVEVKIADTYKAEIETLWPSNKKYRLNNIELKKWKLIATFEHNGDSDSVTVWDIQAYVDGNFLNLSVTNATK